ncbi:hypothetical protein DVK02_08005 [Halobellus sp. Atlit-31R]|nr:hypothetical protein DVK02_08005 [Halobellus sp. Atlit-31R]
MGFACPVCEIPQQDATHLANHLAFTAMVHADDHEAWLDEHVPEWAEHGEAELAPKVAELASETDYEQVFEDTAHAHGHGGHGHQHGQQPDHASGVDPEAAAAAGRGALDDEARAVLAEARELTAEMIDSDGEEETDTAARGSEADGVEADDGTESGDDAG